MRQHTLIGCLAILFFGCAGPTEPAADQDICTEAATTVAECTGTEPTAPTSCDGDAAAAAQSVVDGGCEGLADSKSDSGFWCGSLVRWMGLCADDNTGDATDYIAELVAHAPAAGTYVGIADAHGALAVDPSGEPCTATIEATNTSITVLVDSYGMVDAFVLDDAPDRHVASFERHTDEFADGSGREFETVSIMVDTGEGTSLFTTSLDIVRFDNGNATVRVSNDDTPMSTCTFQTTATTQVP